MKSVEFEVSLGINAGYGHGNENQFDSDRLGTAYQEEAAQVMAETGVYVSATMIDGKALYHTDWGCPVGGEVVAVFEGVLNPQFAKEGDWKAAVEILAARLKKRFRQTTVMVVFREVEISYLAS